MYLHDQFIDHYFLQHISHILFSLDTLHFVFFLFTLMCLNGSLPWFPNYGFFLLFTLNDIFEFFRWFLFYGYFFSFIQLGYFPFHYFHLKHYFVIVLQYSFQGRLLYWRQYLFLFRPMCFTTALAGVFPLNCDQNLIFPNYNVFSGRLQV